MVMGTHDGDGTRDRAQLVLVGSIAIAFIIIGLVVVFNTVLFTDNLAARGSVEEVEGASELQQQVDRDVPDLVRHVENGTDTNAELHDDVDQNVSGTYNRLLAETYAESGTVYVNVTYNASESTNGTRVIQDDGSSFNDSAGDTDWEPVNETAPRYIGQFEANVTTGELLDLDSGLLEDSFTIVLHSKDSSEDPVYIQLSEEGGEFVLNQTRDGVTQNLCTINEDHVRLNITNGSSPDAACSYNSTNVLSGPYWMEFQNADNIEGNYSFLVNGTMDSNTGIAWDRNGPDTPYANLLLLEAGIELYYESRTVVYQSNQTVTVREAPQ